MELLLPSEAKTVGLRVEELNNEEYQKEHSLEILSTEKDVGDELRKRNSRIARIYDGGVERIIASRRFNEKKILEIRAKLIIHDLKTIYFSYEVPLN